MSNKIETKLVGTTLSTSATFKNTSNQTFAPSLVNLKYKKSDTNGTIVTTPVTPDVSNVYTTSVLLDVPGTWNFRWEAVGSVAVADEFQIIVTDTKVK